MAESEVPGGMHFSLRSGEPSVEMATAGRFICYLDIDAIVEMAREDKADLRARFVLALKRRGILAFSVMHAIELGRLAGDNLTRVREFLDEVGHLWLPFEMRYELLLEREDRRDGGPPLSNELAKGVLARELSKKTVVAGFPSAAAALDWAVAERLADPSASSGGWLRKQQESLRDQLRATFKDLRDRSRAAGSLDDILPPRRFDEGHRCAFVFVHLLRELARTGDGMALTANDALDFLHAVVGTSYCRVISLDRKWQRLLSTLPEPHDLGPVFYKPELSLLVERLEKLTS
jgi:hypothetical protein